MGIIFDIPELMLDGFLHLSELGSDYYVFNEERQRLQGVHTGHSFLPGVRFKIELVGVDFITLDSKWQMHEADHARKKTKKKRRRSS